MVGVSWGRSKRVGEGGGFVGLGRGDSFRLSFVEGKWEMERIV